MYGCGCRESQELSAAISSGIEAEKMKTLYMETTKKEPEETSAEIAKLLKNYGLTKFMHDYHDGEIVGCIFSIQVKNKEIPIKLPVRWEPLWIIAQRGETKYAKDENQCRRIAWRQSLRWIESQLAFIDSGSVEMTEIFLPYMMINKNKTLYQHLVENDMQLIETTPGAE